MVESHGGYLCRYEDIDAAALVSLARQAIADDGEAVSDIALALNVLADPGLVRFSWDAPFTYGRRGARWYLSRHAFARRLSQHLAVTVHTYVFDADELEQVVAWGNGRRVGGDSLRYDAMELPEDDEAFVRAQSKWPLSHLGRVLGIDREELIRLPRQPTVLLDLERRLPAEPLWMLFPEELGGLRSREGFASP